MNSFNLIKHLGISIETYKSYGVSGREPDGEPFQLYFPYTDGTTRVFNPQRYKWETIGKKRSDVSLFGFNQLPKVGEKVIITEGEIAVLTFAQMGIKAICLAPENTDLNFSIVRDLKKRFSDVIICFNRSKTGIEKSRTISEKFELINFSLPNNFRGKDINDFLRERGSKKEVFKLLNIAILEHKEQKSYGTAGEIIEMSNKAPSDIMKGIIPSLNIIGIMGGSDLGKSLFCLQFCICYILQRRFLDLKLKGNKKVLICSTEDDHNSLGKRLNQMMKKLSDNEKVIVKKNLLFEMESEDLEGKIRNKLELDPEIGFILIDPLSEFLAGADMNNAGSIRLKMRELKSISQKYKVCVAYIHHVSKQAEKSGKFGKSNSNGSQSIEAKSRVLIELKKSGRGELQIAIVKGNDIDSRFKFPNAGKIIKSNRDSHWFETVNRRFVASKPIKKKKKIDWARVFGDHETMRTSEIISKLKEIYGGSTKTHEKTISKELGNYRVKVGVYKNPSKVKPNKVK
ncbi:bifunctional DNA primase/helicase [Cyclobacterium sp. SYSU L10401]|uniref:bifunctional DNA primase/helicase n=1 Tax=Cyclobacterium sp. SYSU L10401 TaxID=2678657 RepID=UPI0013D2C9FE|nr:bifunctional DNA primase/helicase [Cyclobacterium sp. SYSU L10401]